MSTMKLPLVVFVNWLANGERGMSSEAMVAHMTGQQIGRTRNRGDYPWDLDDFRRCELLLREVPPARTVLHDMREVSPTWARVVDAWDEIVALVEQDAPDFFTRRGITRGGSALGGRRLRVALGRDA
jgi:hypothetical protein